MLKSSTSSRNKMTRLKSPEMSHITADVVLTSYIQKDIDNAIKALKNSIEEKQNYKMGKPAVQKVKANEEIHGCRVNELNRKSFTVTGPAKDLPKLNKVKIPEGVYFQLLYKNWETYLKVNSSKKILKIK